MLRQACRALAVVCAGSVIAWAQGRAYVLKRGEGEKLFGGNLIIKASPRSGSQSAEMIWNAMVPGQSTGIHVHHVADEFFYVVGGKGLALVGGKETTIEAGDVVFVPKGKDHRLKNADKAAPLEIVFLVDKPGLASDFRNGHAEFEKGMPLPSVDELNKRTRPNGTTYKTLQ